MKPLRERPGSPDIEGRNPVRIIACAPAVIGKFNNTIKFTDRTDRAHYDLYMDALRRQHVRGSARLVPDTIAGRLTASLDFTPRTEADESRLAVLHVRFGEALKAWAAAGRPRYNSIDELRAFLPKEEVRRRS